MRLLVWISISVLVFVLVNASFAFPRHQQLQSVFNITAIKDVSTINVKFVSDWTYTVRSGVPTRWREMHYTSYEVNNGTLSPITIDAFYAEPVLKSTNANLPGIVNAHGLGGEGTSEMAVGMSALSGSAVIAYSGPGQGKSEGHGTSDPKRFWYTIPDPRGSWLWGHAMAGMRAITAFQALNTTSAGPYGFTGYSAGSLATLISSGVDDRIVVGIPVEGSGSLMRAAIEGGWENDLLTAANLTRTSAEYTAFCEFIDPILFGRSVPKAHMFLIDGAQDEFFPIDSYVSTYNAFANSTTTRTMMIGDWDHGYFAYNDPAVASYDNSKVASEKAESVQRMAFKHYLFSDATYPSIPQQPVASAGNVGGALMLYFEPDSTTKTYDIAEANAWISNDGSYSYLHMAMKKDFPVKGVYGVVMPVSFDQCNPDNCVYFVDIRYQTKSLLDKKDIWISTVPSVPESFSAKIRPIP